jgi:transposase
MLLIGYFEGIDSERRLEWRCADSLWPRELLRLGVRESMPDHSRLSRPAAACRWKSTTRCSPGC